MNDQEKTQETPTLKSLFRKSRHREGLKCLALFLLPVLCIVGMRGTASNTTPSNKPPCCTNEVTGSGPLSDRSLYQLDSTWTNDAAVPLRLDSLRGRPQIVTMFFAKCEYACPILVHDMKRIESALPLNVRTNIGFVLVSFDSERDTPEALAVYRKNHALAPNWTLLRGVQDDVLELAALLGVKFRKDSRGQFAHSNVITVLNAKGEIVLQETGLNHDPGPIVVAVQKAFNLR